jgi:hypothetical protein
MDNNTLQIKFKQRLNKLDSYDNDNLECWQMAEAFNKAQLETVRDIVQGYNQKGENRESGLVSIDDLQLLISEIPLKVSEKKNYGLTDLFPDNYLYFKSVRAQAQSSTCSESRKMRVFLAEETNADDFELDNHKKPSFPWQETFATVLSNRVRIYTNGEFTISASSLVYYRKPRSISFEGCVSLTDGSETSDVACELKDDLTELIVDRAVAILAGDINDFNQAQRGSQNATQHL